MRFLTFAALTAALSACSANRDDGAIWVSPNGDDQAAGTITHPFRTLSKAVSAARLGPKSVIRLADGVYELGETLELGPDDSGLTVEAASGAVPVISAGRRIRGWTLDGRGWWHVRLQAGTRFCNFFVNGVRRPRPYLPRKGYFVQGGLVEPDPTTGRQRIVYCGEDVNPDWKGLSDAEFCFFHIWTMSRMRAVSVDSSNHIATMAYKAIGKQDLHPFGNGRYFRVDNLEDALGEPGDWYLDRKGELTYVPVDGEAPERTETVAACREHVVIACGATNVTFRNIAFAHADWKIPRDGVMCGQAAVRLPAAIETSFCTGFRLEGCTVAHVGAWAVSFGDGSRQCAVRNCHLADFGAGGVRIGNGKSNGDADASRWGFDCSVENSLIEHGGRMDPAGCGVWIGNAQRTRIAHNTIHDMYYTGVSSGWRWALGPNPTRESIIEWNHIHHIGQHVLSDMAGIYTLGAQPGTVERYNLIHDIDCQLSGNGIYFDSGSAFLSVSNNIVHDVSEAAWFMARISAKNLVANNIFAFPLASVAVAPARDPASSASTFRNNILVWNDAVLCTKEGTGKEVEFSGNIAWRANGKPFEEIPGFEFTDPGFKDAENRDFAFVDEDKVRRLGFEPFSLAGVGCNGRPGNGFAVPPVPESFAYVEPQSFPLAEDFEDYPIGACPWGAHPNSATNLVTVTDRTAVSGRKSLEVVNSVGDWMPHFNVKPYRRAGKVTVAFSVKIEKGAAFAVSMRDPDKWVAAPGPTVAFDMQANVVVNGKKITQVPVDKWLDVELTFELGNKRRDAEFALRLRWEGMSSALEFQGLAFHRDFRRLNWIGFMCGGCKKGERYYVDNFRVIP